MQETAAIVKCPKCQTGYKWKPQLAGKQATCKCGSQFWVPVAPPSDLPEKPDEYGLDRVDPEPAAPAPAKKAKAATLSRFPEIRQRQPVEAEDETKTGPIRDYVVPAVLLALAVMIDFSQVSAHREIGKRPTLTPGQMIVVNVLGVSTLMVTVGICAALMRMSIGSLLAAALKLTATAMFSVAIGVYMMLLVKFDITGVATGFSAMLLIYWGCIGLLFKFELHEVALTIAAITVFQAFVTWTVFG